MGEFEVTLRHRGATTEIVCSGDLSDGAMDRVKEAVEIALRRGSTNVRVNASGVSIRGGAVAQERVVWLDPPDETPRSAAAGADLASYYLG